MRLFAVLFLLLSPALTDAEQQVHDQIWAEVVDHIPMSKRVMMTRARIPRTERKLEFNVAETLTDDDDETFFAFTVHSKSRRDLEWQAELTGCFYPDSEKIFVLDEAAKKHVTASEHPALAKPSRSKMARKKIGACEVKSDQTS